MWKPTWPPCLAKPQDNEYAMPAFKKADLYELLGNRGGRLEREGPFLLEALAAAPSKTVADLACGLGLHARYLGEQGAQVHAFDLSPEMIAHARSRRPHPNVAYEIGDMRSPSGGPYGMMLCLGNSLSLLDAPEDLECFFSRVYERLLPEGILLIQSLNYAAPSMGEPRMRVEQADLPRGHLAAIKRFLPENEQTRLAINYLMVSDTGLEEASESFLLKHWSAEHLTATAAAAGFTVEGLWGGYDQTPFHKDAPDILLHLRRPAKQSL